MFHRDMKRWVCLFVSVLLCTGLFLSGCATGGGAGKVATAPERVYTSHKKVSSWVTDIPEEKRYFYYVGTSTDTDSFDAGKKEAIGDALSQVVSTIGIKATSTATYEERYFAEEYTTIIEAELFTEGKAKLQDAEITEIYYERWERPDGTFFFRVWLLLKYAKAEIELEQERLAEIIQLKYGEVQHFEELAAQYESQGQLVDAISAHLSACVAALKIDEGDVYFDRNMIRASELLLKVRAHKTGEDQLGWVGNPLDGPLGLRLYYLEGEREVSISNVPVRFSYRVPKVRSAGYKWMVSSAVTDQEGTAEYAVGMVYEVSRENRVDARIDLSTYLGQLRAAPSRYRESIESFENVLASKRTTFLFASDTRAREIRTAVYFLQYDEDGSVLVKPVTAPAFYEVLFEKQFAVRVIDMKPGSLDGKEQGEVWQELDARAAKGTRRIIFGTAQVVEYDTVSGYEMARVTAEAALLDRETDEIIRTWQIQRSGTGSSREAARLNAFTQVGRSLGEVIANTMP